MDVTPRSRAETFLLATTLIWGGTFVAMKIGLTGMSAMMLIALRFTIAAFVFLLFLSRKIFPISQTAAKKGALLGVILFLGFVAQTTGLYYTSASKSSFITSMMVVFAPFLQVVLERRPPTVGNLLGVLIICVGLWFLTSPAGSEMNVGDVLTLVCSILFGLYIVYLDIISKEIGAFQLTFLQVATCALLAWTVIGVVETPTFEFSLSSLAALGYLTVFATLLTTTIQTAYQKDTTPTRAAIIFTIEPVFACIFAFLVLGENIGGWGFLGGTLIISGVLLSELSDSLPGLSRPAYARVERPE